MKSIFFIFYLAIGFIVYSCTNSEAGETPINADGHSSKPDSKENQISFRVNEATVKSSGWNISRSLMDEQLVLNITSNMHDDHRTINININGDTPGSYRFSGAGAYNKPGAAYGSFFADYDKDLMNPYHFEEGEFVITNIDTAKGILNASFSAIVKSAKGETLMITDGIINKGKLRVGIMKY